MSDEKLKLELAKMLSDKILHSEEFGFFWLPEGKEKVEDYWDDWLNGLLIDIRDTEWLHICWLVEQTLDRSDYTWFDTYIHTSTCEQTSTYAHISASWQQRALALCKIKNPTTNQSERV